MLAEFGWDPQIRGIVILVTAVAILPGSVYLLLATNMGARIGFLLAVAGLSGWITLMGTLWFLNGQGLKGRLPSWDSEELVIGPPGESALSQLEGLAARRHAASGQRMASARCRLPGARRRNCDR